MEETIFKISKLLHSWVSNVMSKKGLQKSKPSASYIAQVAMEYPLTSETLKDSSSEVIIRSIFTTYYLFEGDNIDNAINKTNNFYEISLVERVSEPYESFIECDYCDGNGQVFDNDEIIECGECYGSGVIENTDNEIVDVENSMIITSNKNFVDEIKENFNPSTREVKNFNVMLDKYENEILVTNIINDTISYLDEWMSEDVEYVLDEITKNPNYYKIINGEITF